MSSHGTKASRPWPVSLCAQYDGHSLDWTTQLGEAFMLSHRCLQFRSAPTRQAESFGNLKSTPQQVVTTEQNIIQSCRRSAVIYVPQYQPQVVYVQQPWIPCPSITFGAGLAMGIWITYSVNWHGGNVYYNNYGWNNNYHGGGNYYAAITTSH